jgi:SAM-dependent methyltransferase
MIRPCSAADFDQIHAVINDGAEAYRGLIPADRWHEPYMTRDELAVEIARGVRFSAFVADGELSGVMGVQDVEDVTLIRHAYVRTTHQGRGVGGQLLGHLMAGCHRPVLVGTWAAATWAIRFYEHHGFRLLSADDRTRLLHRYWSIPERQVETSVVLADQRWLDVYEVPCQFSDVDHSSDPDALTAYLDGVAELPTVLAYKAAVLDILDPNRGDRVLDVGCGLGDDVVQLARRVGPAGRVIALDYSRAMVELTSDRLEPGSPVSGVVGDARRLPFPDRLFDGCRSDKVLQHIDSPARAVTEMARVIREGGRVVIAEPDWRTFTVTAPVPEVGAVLGRYACDSIAAGWIGSAVGELLEEAGMDEVNVVRHRLVAEDLPTADRLFRVRDFVEGAGREGLMRPDQGLAWIEAAAAASEAGAFTAHLGLFVSSGVRG